ncbi:hypothetical protein [Eubacterium ramulus]|uniref:hypothetical protein n=1 Tax=Eubacterium ramulus TaxID=39490 RepID=UPI0026ED1111|nr:hypothetical protein [Eubacterium ramulus]
MAIKGSAQTTLIDVTDAYSVMLTSEAYTFQGNSEGAPAGSTCSTDIVAYCGDVPCKISVSSEDIVCPTGISASVENNNSLSPIITFKTTAVIKVACEATVPISVDGLVINKKFSFAIAKTGEKGDTGKDGKQLFAKCLTASDIATKTATITLPTSFSLYVGATVSVTFNESNTATSPTLNVNSTGAKPIYAFGAALSRIYYWVAKSTVQFVYNGSAWVMTADSAMSLAAQWACKNDTTYIEGSKIYAETIGTKQLAANAVTAEKIDVDDLFAQKITATHLTIEGDSVFKGTIDGATGTFSGNVEATSIIVGHYDAPQGEEDIWNSSYWLTADDGIISMNAHLGRNYASVSCSATESGIQSSSGGGGASSVKCNGGELEISASENLLLNGTDWDTFKSQHGYDWSTFGTADNTSTWMPVANGGKIYHRDVAATFKQANNWQNGTTRWTCLRLSNDIVLLFVKATATTKVDITSAAAKGYASREYTCDFPITIKTILYANSYVENNYNWENVELKIHSISSTAIKSHFWCQNSYKGLPIWWYYMLVAQM